MPLFMTLSGRVLSIFPLEGDQKLYNFTVILQDNGAPSLKTIYPFRILVLSINDFNKKNNRTSNETSNMS
jgi:hypothetical protein